MINQEKVITVWITKYALTHGIEEKKAIIKENRENDIKIINPKDFLSENYYGEGKDWHKTKEAAIKRAKEMRDKKVKSLEKQIEKLRKIKFE
ncbi:MAG: hypothetical protein LIR50_14950 [Bacillota bacterium]|nr:hypothetical protein [Bacillota bacterium]